MDADHPVAHFEPNRTVVWSRCWNFRLQNTAHTNNEGWVSEIDYDRDGQPPLLALVGDSYVEAIMISPDHPAAARLRRAWLGRVYSFGLSRAPLSQYLAMARYVREAFHPSWLVVLVVSNDFDESLRKYRNTPGMHYFTEGSDGALRLTRVDWSPSLKGRMARHFRLFLYVWHNLKLVVRWERWRRPTPDREMRAQELRIADSRRVVGAFLEGLPGMAGLPPARILIAVDGMRPGLYDAQGAQEAAGSYFGVMREGLLEQAANQGYRLVDLHPRFQEHFRRHGRWFEPAEDLHWNATGHQVFANAVLETLADDLPPRPSGTEPSIDRRKGGAIHD